jgi:Microcystin-dependent protein
MGTTHGAGDGSTTFNVPDKRGRGSFGKDDMGGTSANRITNQSGGWDGDTLGAAGGSETHQLTQAQIPAYSIGFNKQFGSATTGPTSIIITGNTVDGSGTLNSGGNDSPHNNLPPGIVCNYIIYTGVI